MVWICEPKFISTPPSSVRWMTQLFGSIGACARYGNTYVASITLAAPDSAASVSPSLRAMAALLARKLDVLLDDLVAAARFGAGSRPT